MKTEFGLTKDERDNMKQAVDRASQNLTGERIGMGKLHRRPKQDYPLPEYEADCMLTMLKQKATRTLTTPHAQKVIGNAVMTNDFRFFIRLGRALEQKPIDDLWKLFTKLEKFLLEHWAEKRDGLPELCLLSADGLATVCRRLIGPSWTEGAVTKARQRLGLPTIKRGKITVLEIGGKLRFSDGKGTCLRF